MLAYDELVNSGISSPKIFYLIDVITEIDRELLLDLFTPRQRPVLFLPEDLAGKNLISVKGKQQELDVLSEHFAIHVPKNPKKHSESEKEFELTDPSEDYYVYGVRNIGAGVDGTFEQGMVLFLLAENASLPPFMMHEQFNLGEGMIQNYTDSKYIVTDVGKFLLNQIILVNSFGTLVPYWNRRFDPEELDKVVAKLILQKSVTRAMYNNYMNYGYWYGEDGSISVAAWSEKSLSTDPNVAAVKAALLEKFKNNLDDPIVLADIEKQLVQMDKDYLKGDSSEPFFAVTAGKTFSEQRKKMYLTFGLTVAFDKNTGNYEFVEESLASGLTIKNLDVGANDIRRGSYGRGIETAKGGEQTKFVLRIFQEVSIDEEDCFSKQGLPVLLTKKNVKNYLGRWMTDGTLLDEHNADQYIGKEVLLRSPMYCKSKPGFCYKCVGELFRERDTKAIGMDAVIITSTFTTIAMKSMHVSGIQSTKIENFHRFLRS